MNQKILIVLPNDNLGGAEQYLKMVAEFFYQEGYMVDVYFLKKKVSGAWDVLQSNNFKLHFTNYTREKFGVFGLLKNLVKNRKIKYRYVFTSHIHVNSFIARLRKLKVVRADYHIARESTSTFDRYRGLKLFIFRTHYKYNYDKIDLLICQTDFMYNQLKKALPQLFKKVKVRTFPNPINLKNPKIDGVLLYSNFIVSAGRLINEKGFDILIESFYQLQKYFPDKKLVILGEGKLRVNLETKIKELGLENRVFLPGFVDNVYLYFRQAELCVVSSRIEGFPNVLLQMMSQNNKVVSTKCAGGIDEIKGIEIAETNNVNSLFKAMKNALDKQTSDNRSLFDRELESRSINKFIEKIEKGLHS